MKGPKNKKVTRSGGTAIPGVDVIQLEQLLDFMAAHDLEEFEYAKGGLHIRLKKASAAGDFVPRAPISKKKSRPDADGTPETSAAEELHIIKSPIVGTFYSAPSPEAASFVKVGDSVHGGQVVCIIEAMKLMNEIEADTGGKVVRVLVENGQPVEYGQPLFALSPEKK